MNASISTTEFNQGNLIGRRLVCFSLHLVAYLYLTFKPLLLTETTSQIAFSIPLAQNALLTLLALLIHWRTEWRFCLAISGLVISWYSLSKFGMWSVDGATAAEMAVTLLSISISATIGYTVFCVALAKRRRKKLARGVPPVQDSAQVSGATVGLKSLVLWTTLFAILFALARYGEGFLGWSSEKVRSESLMAHVVFGAPLGIIAVTLLALSDSWKRGVSFRTTVVALGVIVVCVAFQNFGISYFVPRPGLWDWTTYLSEISFVVIVGSTLVFWAKGPSSSNEASRI